MSMLKMEKYQRMPFLMWIKSLLEYGDI